MNSFRPALCGTQLERRLVSRGLGDMNAYRNSRSSPPHRHRGFAAEAPLWKGQLKPPSSSDQTQSTTITHEISSLFSRLLLNHRFSSLSALAEQYDRQAGRILPSTLPNGSIQSNQPGERWKARIEDSVVTVAHVITSPSPEESEVHLASGFFIQPTNSNPCIVTCAHTLYQARHSPCLQEANARSGTIVVTSSGQSLAISHVLSSLPLFDIMLLSYDPMDGFEPISLPVSMYPAQEGTTFRTRFVSPTAVSLYGGRYADWKTGKIDGYRDFAGRESKPGTYDALSHMIFSPPPTPGTSGAPIIDCEAGNVVGMVTGSRMYNRVEGLKGWGTPSEAIFELFSLPL
ncbi:hypothetical protein M407DRAFT_29431 [Tulasnella calospora MUT 4182]|uniref:Serine protease n=1 Tax=Tulasnella calospora MUT 4182 TaxID=1051891 RepID=A0A0C3LHN0_9AGAM|nr:hypothetical protein M407DRAFT_29431 [Tulasnella calospora MUT 4182]